MKTFGLGLRQGLQRTIYPLWATTTIGRAPDNTITVVHPTVSRKHARRSLEGSSWVIEDLGSVNGIVFEDRRVDNLKLSPGDIFLIGEIEFYFFDMEVSQGKTQFIETVEILLAAVEEEDEPPNRAGVVERLQRIQDVIASIPLFSPLDETHRRELVETAAFHVFDAGELIIRQGDLGGSIYTVLDGKVRVFTKDHRNNELELAALGPSEFFGEMSFLSGKLRPKSVAAIETTVLAELNSSNVRKLLQENPAVQKELVKYSNVRFQDIKKRLAEAGR
jgi:transcriptional regulator of NAD metabolism